MAVSLKLVSINTVLANQFTHESIQIASTQVSSESSSKENPEEKPQPDSPHPKVAENADILKEKTAEKDITIQITDGFRTYEEQDALYAQSRTEHGNIVTNAKGGKSYHNYGLAVDFSVVMTARLCGTPLITAMTTANPTGKKLQKSPKTAASRGAATGMTLSTIPTCRWISILQSMTYKKAAMTFINI